MVLFRAIIFEREYRVSCPLSCLCPILIRIDFWPKRIISAQEVLIRIFAYCLCTVRNMEQTNSNRRENKITVLVKNSGDV